MTLYDIKPIENADFYLDIAFRNASKQASNFKSKSKVLEVKVREKEILRLSIVKDELVNRFDKIIMSFPSIRDLTEFYKKLIELRIGVYELKKSLGALNWCRDNILKFFFQYSIKIRKCQDINVMKRYRTECYGRISSLVKQVKSNLNFLKEARKIIIDFPVVKKMHTVAIAGFPNVGKSTLLSKLTESKPEIASYAFTTKDINIGYMGKKIQLIDTPGTLNRFDKMNKIEQEAYLALKYVTDKIIYIFDLTEPYPLKGQIKLLKRMKEFKKPIIIYLSKTDILEKNIVEEFSKRFKIVDLEELKRQFN